MPSSLEEYRQLKRTGQLEFDPGRMHVPIRKGDTVNVTAQNKTGSEWSAYLVVADIDGYNQKIYLKLK